MEDFVGRTSARVLKLQRPGEIGMVLNYKKARVGVGISAHALKLGTRDPLSAAQEDAMLWKSTATATGVEEQVIPSDLLSYSLHSSVPVQDRQMSCC